MAGTGVVASDPIASKLSFETGVADSDPIASELSFEALQRLEHVASKDSVDTPSLFGNPPVSSSTASADGLNTAHLTTASNHVISSPFLPRSPTPHLIKLCG